MISVTGVRWKFNWGNGSMELLVKVEGGKHGRPSPRAATRGLGSWHSGATLLLYRPLTVAESVWHANRDRGAEPPPRKCRTDTQALFARLAADRIIGLQRNRELFAPVWLRVSRLSGCRMRSIAIINQKGGVGKTTTAVNVAAALADCGQRVCLIDLDPQAHASLHFGIEPQPGDLSMYDVMIAGASLADVRRQVDENLWVVGSHLDLAAADVELAGVEGRQVILRDKLRQDDHPLDYLFIDCPPSLGILTLNALAAVEEVFLPLQPHFLALHGLSKLLQTIEAVAGRLNGKLKLSGVILCMYESGTRLAAEVSDDVNEFFRRARSEQLPWSAARTFHTRIRRNIRLAEAPSFGQSIFRYAPNSHGAEDYQQLAREILAAAASRGARSALPADFH